MAVQVGYHFGRSLARRIPNGTLTHSTIRYYSMRRILARQGREWAPTDIRCKVGPRNCHFGSGVFHLASNGWSGDPPANRREAPMVRTKVASILAVLMTGGLAGFTIGKRDCKLVVEIRPLSTQPTVDTAHCRPNRVSISRITETVWYQLFPCRFRSCRNPWCCRAFPWAFRPGGQSRGSSFFHLDFWAW